MRTALQGRNRLRISHARTQKERRVKFWHLGDIACARGVSPVMKEFAKKGIGLAILFFCVVGISHAYTGDGGTLDMKTLWYSYSWEQNEYDTIIGNSGTAYSLWIYDEVGYHALTDCLYLFQTVENKTIINNIPVGQWLGIYANIYNDITQGCRQENYGLLQSFDLTQTPFEITAVTPTTNDTTKNVLIFGILWTIVFAGTFKIIEKMT